MTRCRTSSDTTWFRWSCRASAPIRSHLCEDLADYAQTLLAMTQKGSVVMAVGVNALLVLHALQRRPWRFLPQRFVGASRCVSVAAAAACTYVAAADSQDHSLVALLNKPTLFAQVLQPDLDARAVPAHGRCCARCRAFVPHWDLIRDTALPLLEADHRSWSSWSGAIRTRCSASNKPPHGRRFARADLTISLKPGWGHYPWIDAPMEVRAMAGVGRARVCCAHQGGRLRLAELARQAVPAALTSTIAMIRVCLRFLAAQPDVTWAVRSSSYGEDQADSANAGLSTTYLREPHANVPKRIAELTAEGAEKWPQ